ncbi:MAG: hypothetical protein QM688_11515 [Sphingomonas bacterium]
MVAALFLVAAAAQAIAAGWAGSIALAANGIGHLVNAAIMHLLSMAFSPARRLRQIVVLGYFAMLLALFDLWVIEFWWRLTAPAPPKAILLALFGAGAILVDVIGALMLSRLRPPSKSVGSALRQLLWPYGLTGPLVLVAAGGTALSGSPWSDLVVGLGIAVCNFGAVGRISAAASARGLNGDGPGGMPGWPYRSYPLAALIPGRFFPAANTDDGHHSPD